MEKKKKFFNPVVWANHCFYWSLFIIGMIIVGIVLAFLVTIFDYDATAEDNIVNTLKGIITAIYGCFILIGSIIFFPILLVTFLGGFVTLFGLIVIREKTKILYIFAVTSITVSILIFYIFSLGFVKYKNGTMEMICHNTLGYLNKQVLQAFETHDKRFAKESWCDYIKTTHEYEYDDMFKSVLSKIN